jgi:hypothetical protein
MGPGRKSGSGKDKTGVGGLAEDELYPLVSVSRSICVSCSGILGPEPEVPLIKP